MTIRKLVNIIGFDVDNSKLKESEAKFKQFQKSAGDIIRNVGTIVTIVGAAGAAIFGFTKNIAGFADEVAKTAKDIGISGEALQEFRYGADLAGIKTEQLDTGLKLFSRTIGNIKSGITNNNPFTLLGISMKKESGEYKSQEELLLDVADKMKNIKDQSLKASISMQLFGRSGIRMAQWLSGGRDEINKTSQEAINFGYVFSESALAAAEEFSDNITRIATIIQGLGKRLGAALIPVANEITVGLIELFTKSDFIGIIKQIADALGIVMRSAFKLLVPIFQLLTPILQIASSLVEKIGAILNSTVIPFISDVIKMIIPLINDLLEVLGPILDILMPIINVALRIVGIMLKLTVEKSIVQLRLFFAILKPILSLLNFILTPLITFLDKLTLVIDRLISTFTERFNGFLDLLLKGNFKEAFMFLVDAIKKSLLDVLNFFIDGANLVIKALNLLPIKNKFELIKKIEIESKNPNINNINTNTKTNNINVNNKIDINGNMNNSDGIKNAMNQTATSVFNLELKKVLVSAGY